MYLIYIDDSRDTSLCCFTALMIADRSWNASFATIRDFRRSLRRSDGIFMHKEFHASEFVAGRGRLSDDIIPKGRRCQIYLDAIRLVASLPSLEIISAVFPHTQDERAFERLLNRINRNMTDKDDNAILIVDEGKQKAYTKIVRKMRIFNHIPSRFGAWGTTGTSSRNIPIDRILEDPFFKNSENSYLIQLADFCAFALLRSENPLPSRSRYGLDNAFSILSPRVVTAANRSDPRGLGIVRP